MSYDPQQVAFIDTETTGLDPERDYVWEVAVIVDGVEHCWQQRWPNGVVDGGNGEQVDWSTVDPWVLANTGIRDRFRLDGPGACHPADGLERFIGLVRGRHLVGACPWFDSERLHRAQLGWSGWGWGWGRALPWHYHLIDVETLIVGFMQGMYAPALDVIDSTSKADLPWTSEDLSRFMGVDPDDFKPRHSALADARWAKACFEAVMGAPQ